ncbi:MAG TPA: MaoC family dehydratase N-terminal domain-containing protein [Dehalococcoidia bacterium]|nr:MaoC family dehydratase N-terminal domain-containing protein [Dehalococcoidia bacterium]
MTTDTPETLVTQEMEDAKGKWESETVSPPISESDIRKWAIATYWPEKPPEIYWNDEYAQTTRFGGLIAPQDFNPFAWPIERQIAPGRATPQGAGVGTRGMNGGQTDTYGVPMKPGDVITTRARLKDWNERQTRLGLTLFQEREVEWRNQDNEVVKTRLSIGIRY